MNSQTGPPGQLQQNYPRELAMSEASLTGFQSWLEARPPGTDWDRI